MNSLDSVKFLTADEFSNADIKKIVETWKINHGHLVNHLKNQDIPYFGLHGTSRESAALIEAQESTYNMFNIATFYNKKKTEEDLYQLYHMCSYVLSYAKSDDEKNSPGNIMVFSLEKNGKNVTYPWERLLCGAYNQMGYTQWDNETDLKFLHPTYEDVQGFDNWRTDTHFVQDLKEPGMSLVFKEHYCGKIPFPNIQAANTPGDYQKIFIKQRLSAQEVLTKALKLVQEKKNGKK